MHKIQVEKDRLQGAELCYELLKEEAKKGDNKTSGRSENLNSRAGPTKVGSVETEIHPGRLCSLFKQVITDDWCKNWRAGEMQSTWMFKIEPPYVSVRTGSYAK